MKYGLLAGLAFTAASHASIDLKANEQPLPVTVDQQAVASWLGVYRYKAQNEVRWRGWSQQHPGSPTRLEPTRHSPPPRQKASYHRVKKKQGVETKAESSK